MRQTGRQVGWGGVSVELLVAADDRELYRALRLDIIEAQRDALLAARDDGTFSASVLTGALETLDADQISMELRGEHRDEA
jgi:monovalent cation/hydrogen antiporter